MSWQFAKPIAAHFMSVKAESSQYPGFWVLLGNDNSIWSRLPIYDTNSLVIKSNFDVRAPIRDDIAVLEVESSGLSMAAFADMVM